MKNSSSNFIKNLFLPCTIFSIVAGVMSTVLITAFQLAADWMVQLSASIYAAVRANPKWLPFLLLGSATVGLLSSLILSRSKSCRGGGIPTSVAAIQGIIHFKWITSVFLLPISSLLSFICGIPLGTEGPCVQMGTGIGDGVVCLFGKKKHIGWRRYIMTGGASAGFSSLTPASSGSIIIRPQFSQTMIFLRILMSI